MEEEQELRSRRVKKKTDRQKIIKSIFQIHSYTIHLKKSKQNKRQKPKVTFFPIPLFLSRHITKIITKDIKKERRHLLGNKEVF